MSNGKSHLERQIITRALDFPGLVSPKEMKFILKISNWPHHYRLSPAQSNWLYDIGEFKLNMKFNRPTPEAREVVDYKARACA